ncbi:Mitochondrial sulfhydryl oxidase, partial [Pseudoloma neurophilia]
IVSVVNFTYGLLKNGFNILKKDVKILADFIKEVSSNIMNLTFMLYKQFITKSKNDWKHFNLRYTLRRFLVSSITFTIRTFRFFKNSMIQDIPDLFYKLRNLQSAQAIKYRFSQLRTGLSNWYISIIQQVEFELNEPYNMTIYEKNTLDTIPLENLKINIEKEQLYHSEETKETDELQPKSEEQRNEILIKKNANTQSSNEVKGCNLKADLRKKLGNATWYLLHTITLKYPEKPTLNEQTDMASFLVLLSRIFPCDECQGHFQKMIERERPDLSSRENFKRWMFKIHNIVNKRIHKPEYDYENLEKDYACGC